MKKSFLLILKKLHFGIGINNLEENHNELHFVFRSNQSLKEEAI